MSRDREPFDEEAEHALIGAALLDRTVVDATGGVVVVADFHKASHQHIWHAIERVHATGAPDAISVAAELATMGWVGPEYTSAAVFLFQFPTPAVSSARRYANTIADLALRRKVIYAAIEVGKLGWGETPTESAGDALDRSRAVLAAIETPHIAGLPDQDIDQFIAGTDTTYDWLIPNVLERQDRMLVTAAEGAGKSTLLAQMAVCAAAGKHPWWFDDVPPVNVLVIDLENGKRLVSRRFDTLRHVVADRLNPARLRILSHPHGLDLTKRADRLWLYDRVAANQADLLVIGPTYRMMAGAASKGDAGAEDQTRMVTQALDDIRTKLDCALLMETHAPHGGTMGRDLRPFGSSVWLRWPEFGIGLAKDDQAGEGTHRYTVQHWRGPRDQREWPVAITRSRTIGTWLWTPDMDTIRHTRGRAS